MYNINGMLVDNYLLLLLFSFFVVGSSLCSLLHVSTAIFKQFSCVDWYISVCHRRSIRFSMFSVEYHLFVRELDTVFFSISHIPGLNHGYFKMHWLHSPQTNIIKSIKFAMCWNTTTLRRKRSSYANLCVCVCQGMPIWKYEYDDRTESYYYAICVVFIDESVYP